MLTTGAVAPRARANTLISPVRGAASSDQATAPIRGGVMKGMRAATSIAPLSGVSVRAVIHTSGSANTNASGTVPATSHSVLVTARASPGSCQSCARAVLRPCSP
jgi:hypothetical protein